MWDSTDRVPPRRPAAPVPASEPFVRACAPDREVCNLHHLLFDEYLGRELVSSVLRLSLPSTRRAQEFQVTRFRCVGVGGKAIAR